MSLPADALNQLLGVLGRLELAYVVVGSSASAIYGLPRMTNDVDMLVELSLEDARQLIEMLKPDFYADADDAKSAIEYSRSFNLIHIASTFKFDIFPITADPFQQKQISRRRYEETRLFSQDPIEIAVASPEDTILSKLHGYRKGGEASTQQWNDVLGVIAARAASLDRGYLTQWATYLGVADLLAKAFRTFT